MSLEENKTVYRRFIDEAFNHGNFANLGELLTPEYEVMMLLPARRRAPRPSRQS